MHKIIQITTIILILLSVCCANISEASALLPGVSLHKENDSVAVHDVTRGSKTWDMGIRTGDILIKIDNQVIKTLDDYVRKTKSISSNGIVTLLLSRHGEEYAIIKNNNNYHRKSKEIEQNEKTNITDNEVSTEKQSISNDVIKRNTYVLSLIDGETKVSKLKKFDTVKGLKQK